jgi:hypothetical protein
VQVFDAQGGLVRDLEIPQGERGTGIHRVVWDLRHPLAFTPARSEQVSFFGGRLKGPFVLPGEYRVRLTVGSAEQTQTVTVKSDPLVTISPESRRAWHDTLTRVNQLQATVRSVLATASQLESHVKSAREAIARHGSAAPALSDDAGRIAAQIAALFRDIRGGDARSAAEQEGPLPLGSQLDQLFANIEASTAEPTDDQRWLIQHCEERLADVVARVNRLLTEAVPAFDKALDQNGVPWTSGRSIAMPPVPKPGSGPSGRR